MTHAYPLVALVIHAYLAKKEAKRLEKEAKLATKAAKASPAADKKPKVEKGKKDDAADSPFVNLTPMGEKKGSSCPAAYLKLFQRSYRFVATHGGRIQSCRHRGRVV